MDFSSLSPVALLASLMVAATPIMLAAIGELVVEKSGVLNLGVEGMMIVGAVCGFITAVETGSAWFGLLGAVLGGILISSIFAFLTQILLANQVASGLALTLFGLGVSAMIGNGYTGIKPPGFNTVHIPLLSDLPFIGPAILSHDPIVYIGILLVAHALGYKVIWIRFSAILFGGMCAGLGGAYLSLVRVPQWTEGMTAGAGWIALAIVVFASWKPYRLILGAYLFGGVTIMQLNLQALGVEIGIAYLSMAPYLVTIIVLVMISSNHLRSSANAPGSLGRIFHASQ
jgi:ABC-type uncharacterized transport system permease subunit